jgi:hypothetical protein
MGMLDERRSSWYAAVREYDEVEKVPDSDALMVDGRVVVKWRSVTVLLEGGMR